MRKKLNKLTKYDYLEAVLISTFGYLFIYQSLMAFKNSEIIVGILCLLLSFLSVIAVIEGIKAYKLKYHTRKDNK